MKKENSGIKYFVYARKSTESEDRQIASIGDQINELKRIAKEQNLNIVDVLFESKSAKNPNGRVVFNQMLVRIHKGEANGIICWKLNRLARNPVDGGQISWMLQQGTVQHIQTYGRSYYPTDNVLMMAVELGMANQFVRDLSVDTKRGLRLRAERGIPNGLAPIGFINDRTKEQGHRDWLEDTVRYPLVKKLLRTMLTKKYSVRELYIYAKDELKLTTLQRNKEGGKPIAISYLYKLLKNPIYAGFFFQKSTGMDVRYELKGNEPMISEEEYWQIQAMLGTRGTPRVTHRKAVYHYFTKCGTCGGNLSTDFKFQLICSGCKHKFSYPNRDTCPSCDLAIAKMKNPTYLNYIFYYCINDRKHRTHCSGNSIQEKNLEKQLLSDMDQKLVISKELSQWCIDNIGKLKDEALEDSINLQTNLEQEKKTTEDKLKRLTMLRISKDFSDEENTDFDKLQKEMREELSLLELKMSETNIDWLSEAKRDFNLMSEISSLIQNGSVEQKKELLFALGSNLTVLDKKVSVINKKSIEAFKSFLILARAENKAFEPANTPADKDKTEVFASVCPTLHGWKESNLRYWFWRPE